MCRITKPTIGCFEYTLAEHKIDTQDFGTYDAFFDYSMAVKRLGEYENIGTIEEVKRFSEIANAINEAFNCSALGIGFGYIGGSAVESFDDEIELLNWYRSLQPTNTK